jgi:hypothetical protein
MVCSIMSTYGLGGWGKLSGMLHMGFFIGTLFGDYLGKDE